MKTLGTTPFDRCNFTEIESLNPEPPTSIEAGKEAQVFTAANKTAALTVPDGSKAAYEASPVWSGFASYKTPTVEATEITLSKTTWNTNIGQTTTLTATVAPENTTDKTVTWTSSDAEVASVDSEGKVTALKVGTATITATTANGLEAKCTVTVQAVMATKLELDKTKVSLHRHHTQTLKVTITPTSTTDKTITWTSSDPTVATVSESGVVTGESLGEAIITASTSNGKTATCTVTVIPWSLNGIEYLRVPGGGENGEDIVRVIGGSPEEDGTLAIPSTVEIEGVEYPVTEIAEGAFKDNTDITKLVIPASVVKIGEEAFAGCSNLKEVEANDGTKTLACGTDAFKGDPIETLYLGRNTSGHPFAGNDSLTELTVGKTVTAIAAGDFSGCTAIQSVTALATVPPAMPDDGFEQQVYDQATLHVPDASEQAYKEAEGWKNFVVTQGMNETLPESMSMDTPELEIFEKAKVTLKVTFTPAETTNKKVTWKSSDTKVATVSATGVVTAVKAGKAVITATSETTTADGVTPTATCEVTVVALKATIGGIIYEIVPGGGSDGEDIVKVIGGDPDGDGKLAIPEEVEIDGKIYPVTEIGDGAFKGNTDITKLVIPESVVKVGEEAFSGCSNLKEVEAEDGEKTLNCGTDAFTGAPIETLYLGRDTSGLPFKGQDKLTDLTFGDKVTIIDPSDFEGCTAIQNITVLASIPPEVFEESFDESVYENATLRVPDANVEDYKTDDVWGKFFNILGINEIRPVDIEMETPAIELTEGETATLKATITPENATDKTITWTSSDLEVATVDAEGVVTALKPGTATITATTINALEASCTVTVLAKIIEAEGIELNMPTAEVVEGETVELTATIIPAETTDKTVTWTSSSPEVASIDQNGTVTALKAGKATITAKSANGKEATCVITVVAKVIEAEGIELNMPAAEVIEGDIVELTATITPVETTDKTVIWSSSDETVATVDQNGTVTTLKPGKATITAKSANGQSATCVITVVAKVIEAEGIELNMPSAEVIEGETVELTATITPAETTDKSVTWSSSDETIATVDQNGTVTALKPGKATITAKSANGKEATCVITVVAKVIEAEGIELNMPSAEVIEGETVELTATITPAETTDKSVTWTSSSPEVASVDQNGTVTALKAGKATITVQTANGLKATCVITVESKSGVDGVEADAQISVAVRDGVIVVTAPEGAEVEVYSLTGMRVAKTREHRVEGLSKGVYIVTVGGKAFKVIVR